MSQPLMTNFFNKRKRRAESVNLKSKVLVLDGISNTNVANISSETIESTEDVKQVVCNYNTEIISKVSDEMRNGKIKLDLNKMSKSRLESKKIVRMQRSKALPQAPKSDIRLAFKPKTLNEVGPSVTSNQLPSPLEKKETMESEEGNKGRTKTLEKRVVFELLGGLSPQKKVSYTSSPIKMDKRDNNEEVTVRDARMELGLRTPKKAVERKSKETSMFEIRNQLARSSRLSELRESIKNFKKAEEQLKELEVRKSNIQASSPQLRKFTSIDLEVPISPRKASTSSPMKGSPIRSPLKSPLKSPMKLPAFQRFAHLIQPGVPSLVLPYTYRMLGEIFRCTDTVASMFYNRKETITFPKLKAGVQEMLRRNFTEHHLGQMKKVLPTAFKFYQHKIGPMIGVNKNKYELVINPNINMENTEVSEDTNGKSHPIMTPSVLVERREAFHKHLLEIVKTHHEEFLKNLDPPVIIPRSQLTRWHPEFELEKVPAVKPEQLPQPPSEDKLCTAKEVLDKAKSLFGCNQRMEKALQVVSERMKKEETFNSQDIQANSEPSSLLKGVPKALLDKIRARQAAKALVAMTRTPAEDHEAMQLLRLPEIARILRNIFVSEKKCVLALEVVLIKLGDSYRENLSSDELDQHIRLMIKVVPGWLQVLHIRKTDYLKIAKDTDMSAVMGRLENLAAEKNSKL